MISNLKVDIIYYNTSSDFEFEFNLSGCCRMRIFKEKIEGRKNLISTLARDIARSRIILVVTDLVGENNGVEIVSSAIGYKYETLDKGSNSIYSDEDIKIPSGALPLVTKSGQYGGCIVECGNQSIILISSDRTLRHEVMHSYIHQYIFDINQVDVYNERLKHENSGNPIIEHSNILSHARDEFSAVVETPTVDNSSSKSDEDKNENDSSSAPTADSDDTKATNDNSNEAEISRPETSANDSVTANDDEFIIRSSSTGFVTLFSSDEDEDNIIDEENEKKINKNIPRRKNGGNILLLIIMILLLVGFGLLAYYFIYLPITSGEMPNDIVEVVKSLFS